MRRLKKVVCIMLAGALILSMNAGAVFAAETSSLKFVVENCNVSIVKTSETDISYLYDNSKFIVSRSVSSSTDIVTIKLKSGATVGLFDRVTVYVPDEKYNKIIIESVNAGVSLPEINTDYHVTCSGGSVSFRMVEGYNKVFDCSIVSGSGNLKFATGAKNYTIKLDVTNSSISVPSDFTEYVSGQTSYQYANGSVGAQFNINVSSSAFSIKCE